MTGPRPRHTRGVGYHSDPNLVFGLWLALYPDGEVKMSRGEPSVERTGRKLKLEITVPKTLFKTPELKGTITVSDPSPGAEFKINTKAAAEALRGVLGVDVYLQVVTPAVDP